MHSFINPIVIR